MSETYLFSKSQLAFYPKSLAPDYIKAGTLPDDVIEVTEDIRNEYNFQPPTGKKLDADADGNPSWIDIPPQPNSELLKSALSTLGTEYQSDIESLNRAWLAAAVSDGVNETNKKNYVLSQITERKAKYATDRAAVVAQYPV